MSTPENIRLSRNNNNTEVEREIQKHDESNRTTCQLILTVIAASIGNFLEWFDFAMFGLLANEIGYNFFPQNGKNIQILESFAVFSIAFFMRPIGAVLFGYIGDKYGRIIALQISLFMMSLSTFLTGCLPKYSTIGIFAPILLLIFRLMQGLSVGGEFPGGLTYIYEICPSNQKVFYNALVYVTGCGTLLGTVIVGIMKVIFTQKQLNDYAWRIPFLFGVVVAFFGIWMRTALKESLEFINKKRNNQLLQNPIAEVLKNHKMQMMKAIFHLSFSATLHYILWIWLPEYAYNKDINPIKQIYLINAINFAINLSCVIIWSLVIDKYFNSDPTKSLIFFGIAVIIYTLIMFPFVNEATTIQIIFIQLFWGIIHGFYSTGWSIWGIDRFNETVIRYSAFGISLNVSVALFGGTAPLIATALLLKYQQTWILGLWFSMYGILAVTTNMIHLVTQKRSIINENESDLSGTGSVSENESLMD